MTAGDRSHAGGVQLQAVFLASCKTLETDTGDPYMKSMRLGLNLLAVALVMVLFSAMANAQASRTWVSGVGDDVNPCSRTAPCKTFAGAISKTAAGGEID